MQGTAWVPFRIPRLKYNVLHDEFHVNSSSLFQETVVH